MGRIVVGVDGSESSRRALGWAAEQAERTGATLQVVMAWDDPYAEMWIPHVPPEADRLALTRETLERVAKEVAGAYRGLLVETTALEGHPAQLLVKAAEGADMLVVGNRGHGGFTGLLVGSVSLYCVSHAPCPVVVVRGEPVARAA